MPSAHNHCDSEALQEALDRVKYGLAELRDKQTELAELLAAIQADVETEDLVWAKRWAEVSEALMQAIDAVAEESIVGALETTFKMAGMLTGVLIENERERHIKPVRTRRLESLNHSVKLKAEETKKAVDKAGPLLDAYWACTERLAPKRIRFQLDVHTEHGFLGSALHREDSATGEVELGGAHCEGTVARINRWLNDPELRETYTISNAELTLTTPVFEWTSSGSVTVSHAKRHDDGGPLTFSVRLHWLRSKPDTLILDKIVPNGHRMEHIEGEVTAFGQGSSFSSDKDVVGDLRPVLMGHVYLNTTRPPLSAGDDPSAAWHFSDVQTSDTRRSSLDVWIMR